MLAAMMKLHNYFRSSASFRVRIALHLKGLDFDYIPVHIARGDHRSGPFAQLSADRLVPLLDDEGDHLSQSMAIIEYLDETHPEPPLLPADPSSRAHVRALAQSIACEIHPVNNLRVLKYLVHELKLDEESKNRWYRHWVREGLEAFERQLAQAPAGSTSRRSSRVSPRWAKRPAPRSTRPPDLATRTPPTSSPASPAASTRASGSSKPTCKNKRRVAADSLCSQNCEPEA